VSPVLESGSVSDPLALEETETRKMPTYGWVLESAHDRFYERGGAGLPPAPPVYPCPICAKPFEDANSVSWHVSTEHPIERPVLFLKGASAPSFIPIREALEPEDVLVANCTDARLSRNGRPEVEVDPDELGSLVAQDTDAEHRLRLFNRRAQDDAKIEAGYSLRITVPERAELIEVDKRFVERIAVDNLSMDTVDRFARDTQRFRSARYYADALVAYAIGVLIKERTQEGGATLPFAEFQGKFAHAVSELVLFADRPIALAVTTCARLNLNDFLTDASCGIAAVDECHKFFASLKGRDLVQFPSTVDLTPGSVPVCPVDRDTHVVLQSFAALAEPNSPRRVIREIEERATDATFSGFDRTKLTAMAAGRRLLEGDDASAAPLLRALANDPHLGSWAEAHLPDRSPSR
jgi:hypothetical protein